MALDDIVINYHQFGDEWIYKISDSAGLDQKQRFGQIYSRLRYIMSLIFMISIFWMLYKINTPIMNYWIGKCKVLDSKTLEQYCNNLKWIDCNSLKWIDSNSFKCIDSNSFKWIDYNSFKKLIRQDLKYKWNIFKSFETWNYILCKFHLILSLFNSLDWIILFY